MANKTAKARDAKKERKKLGLALGAGSAKGLAHIGVLSVLEEEDVPIDFIAGSSMGAVVGGVYACGTDLAMASKLLPQLDVQRFMDVTAPRSGGFVKGERFQELIRVLTKNKSYDETDIPFVSVAVDLLTGRLAIQRTGKLHDGIRGSISIPGVFKPHPWQGMLLVDGGVMSRVPCETARGMGADVVIGVDVGYRGQSDGRYDIPLKSTFSYMQLAMSLMQWELVKRQERDADLMIAPYVWDLNSNSFEDASEIIERGRQAAHEAVPKIKELLNG